MESAERPKLSRLLGGPQVFELTSVRFTDYELTCLLDVVERASRPYGQGAGHESAALDRCQVKLRRYFGFHLSPEELRKAMRASVRE